jgi:hypothetical protein
MSSDSNGIETSLGSVEATTLDSLKDHHRRLLSNEEMEIECFYSGNMAESQAIDFYNVASLIVQESTQNARHGILDTTAANGSHTVPRWIPGKYISLQKTFYLYFLSHSLI